MCVCVRADALDFRDVYAYLVRQDCSPPGLIRPITEIIDLLIACHFILDSIKSLSISVYWSNYFYILCKTYIVSVHIFQPYFFYHISKENIKVHLFYKCKCTFAFMYDCIMYIHMYERVCTDVIGKLSFRCRCPVC